MAAFIAMYNMRGLSTFVNLLCIFSLFASSLQDDHCEKDGGCGAKRHNNYQRKLLALTVATAETEGYQRFLRSADVMGIDVETLGMNEVWKGGDIANKPGGGHKVNLLKKAVEKYKDEKDLLLMFVDSYDVIFTDSGSEITDRFLGFDAKIVFSAEGFCWPDEKLADSYPDAGDGKRFLNSGGFIGYAPQIHAILTTSEIMDEDDDQLFYTKIYLDEKLREKYGIRLDHRAAIFQNLNGAVGEVELLIDTAGIPGVRNVAYGTKPAVLHGNGPSKLALNSLANYLVGAWTANDGCLICGDKKTLDDKNLPAVTIGIFVEQPTPFFREFLKKIDKLDYPKDKLSLFIHRATDYHNDELLKFLNEHENNYAKIVVKGEDDAFEWKARNMALEYCLETKCEYYLNVDSRAHIDNPSTLKHLIRKDKNVIAPLFSRYNSAWSNFWGALSSDGFYARSHDYMEVVQNQKRGIWNVPFINEIYLIKKSVIEDPETRPSYVHGSLDPDMAFCRNLREKGIFMFVNNMEYFGHLINSDKFDPNRLHADFHEIILNQKAWQERYIHEEYFDVLKEGAEVKQPCPDVYWFPVVSPEFCQNLIDIMENFGQWSDGSNHDKRLDGGYENVPTRDIHMKQVGLEPQWLMFLREYIRPMQEKVFIGYYSDPPRAIMNFVVRYRPDEQPSLRPHHDASTYTINLALNQVGKDFTGGGARFIRYNCNVTSSPPGWALMHPGRLTHYHEGLTTTSGTRYIMVTFIDP